MPAINPPIATGSTIRNGERPHAAAVTTSPSLAMRYTARVAPSPAAKGKEYSSMGKATRNRNSAISPAESKSPRPSGRRAAPKTASTNTTAKVYPTEPQGLSDHHAIETRQHAEHTQAIQLKLDGSCSRDRADDPTLRVPPTRGGASLREPSIHF